MNSINKRINFIKNKNQKNVVFLEYLAGSSDDFNGKEGLAHLAEHVLFQSTKYDQLLKNEENGITINATTYRDRVIYSAESYEHTVAYLLEYLTNYLDKKIDGGSVDKEKVVIESEMTYEENDGWKSIYNKVFEALANGGFLEKKYSHPVIGFKESLSLISPKDIFLFKEEKYINPRFCFFSNKKIASSDKKIILDFIKNRYKFTQIKEVASNIKTALSLSRTDFFDGKTQVVAFCFDGGLQSKRSVYLSFLRDYIANNWSSVLNQELRSKKQFTYFVNAYLENFNSFSVLYVYYNVDVSNKEKAISTANKIIDNIFYGNIDKNIFYATKKMLTFYQKDSFLYENNVALSFFKSGLSEKDYIRLIEAVTLVDFKHFIKNIK